MTSNLKRPLGYCESCRHRPAEVVVSFGLAKPFYVCAPCAEAAEK